VKNMRHFTSDRCPVTKLTKLQVYVLANVCIGISTDKNIPNGVYRSLIIRGLLTNSYRLTADGCERLANCQILSDQFRRTLLAMPWMAAVSRQWHRPSIFMLHSLPSHSSPRR
jgi:hypothetical protein